MKKQAPLIIGLIVGVFAVAEFYIPAKHVGDTMEMLLAFGLILAAAAFVLGGINLVQVNWPTIRRRERDWGFKVVMLAGAAFMGLIGIKWHDVGGERDSGAVEMAASANRDQAAIRVVPTQTDILVSIDGATPEPATQPFERLLPPGKHKVVVSKRVTGYATFEQELELKAGEMAVIEADLVMHWGPSGRVYLWFYDHVFFPCNATMFALLAFFIASAAFRAFRARNIEAALLLGAAILVMLGRVPIGAAIHDWFPLISDWIVDVPNNAGRRAIMMGAALGGIATGLRVILGLERSHLGAE